MREAGPDEIRPVDLAYLEDRIAVHEGRPQRYGTQFRTLHGRTDPHPIEDPEHLDDRRREVGLGPFEDYARRLRAGDKPSAPPPAAPSK